MTTSTRPAAAGCSAALLAIALMVTGCGGGSPSGAAGDPVEMTFDEIVIPAGEERAFSAERVTIRSRFDVKGTLALSLPPGSTADRVILRLPPGAVIEGTISLRQSVRAATALGRTQRLAAGAPASFVPRRAAALVVEGGIPSQPLYIYSTARLETSAGDDAPEEVLADLGPLRATGAYAATRGGDGGDIHVLSDGVIVLRFPLGVEAARSTSAPSPPATAARAPTWYSTTEPGTTPASSTASVRAGAGGESGRLFIDAAEIRLEDERVGGNAFVIRRAARQRRRRRRRQPRLGCRPSRPDFPGQDRSGRRSRRRRRGPRRAGRRRPFRRRQADRAGEHAPAGGRAGRRGRRAVQGAKIARAVPMVRLSPTRTASQPAVQAFGGNGGSVTAVAHSGAPGTATHPDGHEPGPLEVRFGWGGDVSNEPLFIGRAGNGAGMEAGVTRIRGGDGGDGYSSCGDPSQTVGGAGGSSGHVTVRAGIGGSGPSGGDAGALLYEGVDAGRPGKGGMGLAGGAAGLYGQPDRAPLGPPIATDVRDDPGLRLEGVLGGESRDGRVTFSSSILGTFVLPVRTAGDVCGVVPGAGRILLPAASYHGRFHSSAYPGIVSELVVTTSADCIFLDTRPGLLGAGYADPSRACVTMHEVRRIPSDLDPRGYTESIIDRIGTSIDTSWGTRAAQFLLRESFCSVEGVLMRPGSVGLSEAFPAYDRNGDPAPGPTHFQDHAAGVAPIYPSEVEQTKDYCCKAKNTYPNGRVNGYDVGLLSGGVCR